MVSFWRTLRISLHFAIIDLRQHPTDHIVNTLGVYLAATVIVVFFGAVLKEYLQGYADYARHVALGLVVWVYVSSTIVEGCGAFVRWAPLLRYSTVPAITVPLSIALRRTVYFLVNLGIVLIFLKIWLSGTVGIVGFAKLFVASATLFILCFALAVIGTLGGGRFRDIIQLVVGILNVTFLLTPILWKEHFLGRFEFIAQLNPFRHLIEIVRGPVTGTQASIWTWTAAIMVAAGGAVMAGWMWRQFEPRLRYWL